MNKIKRHHNNAAKTLGQKSSRLTKRANGDIIISAHSRIQFLGLLFLSVFIYFWYKTLLFSEMNESMSWLVNIKVRIAEEPLILIFIIVPLVMLISSLKQMTGFGGTKFRFIAKDKALYQNRKRLCGFDDIDAIVLRYDADSKTLPSITLKLKGGIAYAVYFAKAYSDVSLSANAIAGLVQARIET